MANTSQKLLEMDCLANPNYFDCLPDEVMYKIFSNVPKNKFYLLAKVSPRFERICGDKRFWRKVTVTEEIISYYEFEQLLISGRPCPIRELDLTGMKFAGLSIHHHSDFHVTLDKLNITDVPHLMHSAILNVCRTRELIIDRATICCQTADAIAQRTEIEVLSMDFATCHDSHLSMVMSLDRMFKKCRELKELNLRFCKLYEDQLLMVCMTVTANVEKICINHFTGDLKETPLGGVNRQPLALNRISDHLVVLFGRTKNLKQIGLSLSRLIEPIVLKQVAELKFLESLHFCQCDQDFNLLSKVVEKLPKLKKIYFSMKCPLQSQIGNAEQKLEEWVNDKLRVVKNAKFKYSKSECEIAFD